MSTATKERPILFSGPMVRALLDGRKTQTRRVMRTQPLTFEESRTSWELLRPGNSIIGVPLECAPLGARPFRTFTFEPATSGRIAYAHCNYGRLPKSKLQSLLWYRNWIGPHGHDEPKWSETEIVRICPYGVPGDRLWVRETWSPDHRDFYPNFPVVYRADNPVEIEGVGRVYSPETKTWHAFRWRPSIHMPHWASRITLEIADVRPERVESCSAEDARAEGFASIDEFLDAFYRLNSKRCKARANPWVWAITFRVMESTG